jgi:hypothetical protein
MYKYSSIQQNVLNQIINIGNNSKANLIIDEIFLKKRFRFLPQKMITPKRIKFLEDSARLYNDQRYLAVCDSKDETIFISADEGTSWMNFGDLSFVEGKIARFFTLSHGGFVIQTKNPVRTYLLDENKILITASKQAKYNWHGSQGIDQGPSGTIIFTEYRVEKNNEVVELGAWRKTVSSNQFTQCFAAQASNRPPLGEIRHFHTCLADPEIPLRWYLSAGDSSVHCKFWISNDDGVSWTEIKPNLEEQNILSQNKHSKIFRFTSACFIGSDYLLWPTDDGLGINRSALVAFNRKDLSKPQSIKCFFGENYIRNIIYISQNLLVCISESKNNVNYADMYFISPNGDIYDNIKLPNLTLNKSPVTVSLCSQYGKDNTFFFPNLGHVLTKNKNGIFKVTIKE